MLIPAVLLQWVVDMGTDARGSINPQYGYYCLLACWVSCSLLDMYNEVLRDGPASLYKHMTGQEQPLAPPAASLFPGLPALFLGQQAASGVQPKVRVPLPADVYAALLQVLGQLLPTLLGIWGEQVGLAKAEGMEPAGSSQDAASSAHGRGGRAGGSGNSRAANGSSGSGRVALQKVEEAVMAAGDLVLQMVEQFPAILMGPDADLASSSSAAATAAAAGQLCALLERMCRAEMSVTRHFSALKALGVDISSTSSHGSAADRLYNVSNNLITWKLVAAFVDDPTFKVAPAIDPIIALSSPGSQPCQQLCSLLATQLKIALHHSSKTPKQALKLTAHEFGMYFQRDHFKPFNVLIREIARVIKITCAAVECTTARQAASAAGNHCHDGANDSSSSSSSAAASPGSDVSGSMVLLVLLGRCCLQLGELSTSVSSSGCMVAAAMKFYLDAVVQASSGWLSANSNAAHVQAQGYDAEGVLSCLRTAAALSDRVARVSGDRHAGTAALQAAVSQLQEQLRSVGRALTGFAHPSAGNNPGCMSFSGPSEASLVQGNSGRCSSCKAVR
jgi:hypothetical protein